MQVGDLEVIYVAFDCLYHQVTRYEYNISFRCRCALEDCEPSRLFLITTSHNNSVLHRTVRSLGAR